MWNKKRRKIYTHFEWEEFWSIRTNIQSTWVLGDGAYQCQQFCSLKANEHFCVLIIIFRSQCSHHHKCRAMKYSTYAIQFTLFSFGWNGALHFRLHAYGNLMNRIKLGACVTHLNCDKELQHSIFFINISVDFFINIKTVESTLCYLSHFPDLIEHCVLMDQTIVYLFRYIIVCWCWQRNYVLLILLSACVSTHS